MSVFKAYDIRGIYGDTLDEELARKIGGAFVEYTGAATVVVGHDMRPHSEPLVEALTAGLLGAGADVVDIGLVSTPITYFAIGTLGADGGIMVTASHNPGQWNGFKLCRDRAIPISGETGIYDIEALVTSATHAPTEHVGTRTEQAMTAPYYRHLEQFITFTGRPRVVADFANAMGSVEIAGIRERFDLIPLFEDLDGTFPNHEANPLKPETFEDLSRKVVESGADFGVAFDGDADRCGFVDEHGAIVTMDLIAALIAGEILEAGPAPILYDLRSSWAVKEYIEEHGGTPVRSRVGHAFIKEEMRRHDAPFAGELAGHYYFRENFYTESSGLAMIMIANILSKVGKPLSEVAAPLQRYAPSGEINSKVGEPEAVLDAIRKRYSDGNQFELDGVSVEYEDWWFNVRLSNTEPLLRLCVEARTKELMAEKRDELLGLIRGV